MTTTTPKRTLLLQLFEPLRPPFRIALMALVALGQLALPAVMQAQYTYTTDNGTITITGYTGPGGTVNIPDTINGLPVISIGDNSFAGSALTSVMIGNSVVNIGNYAFSSCTSLTNVAIGNSVTTIGFWAFGSCTSLKSAAVPDSVTSIGGYAFVSCTNLASVIIGNGVASIGSQAFARSGLTNLTIPDSVTTIEMAAFAGCRNLTEITVSALNPAYSSPAGVLYDQSQTLLIQYPPGKSGSDYTIPDGVVTIGDFAFQLCTSLTNITIPDSVTSIGDEAFANCTKLSNIMIPDSVTSLGEGAFGYCPNLASVTIGNSVNAIPANTFNSCTSLTNVTIGSSVTSIGSAAFLLCTSLTSVTIPSSVTAISEMQAFGLCTSLTAITVSALNPAFSSVGGVLFNKTKTTLNLCPGGKAGSFTIPNTVTRIYYGAFQYCQSLTNVTIGSSVTNLGGGFYGCTSLAAITVAAANTVYSSVDGVLFNKSQTTLIQWPEGRTGNYTVPISVTSIGGEASYVFPNLTGVYFQGNAPSVGGPVFYEATNATVYYLPGTTGWGPSFDGRPTALWKPQMQTSDASFGVRTNQFGFNISWASGRVVVVEACTNLTNPVWSPAGTNTLTAGASYFSDPQWTNHARRFYRLRSP